jgi:NTE family protein
MAVKRSRVGLVLGAGGARGFAHIGVIQALNQHHIPIDCIVGSSMGALVGALYATHLDIELLRKVALQLKRKHWLDLVVPKTGLVAGEKVKELVKLLTHGKNIEELKIPLAVVATDLRKGERRVFRTGPAYQAVRASISIPGIFVPVMDGEDVLVDGGVIDRLPVSVAREMGADIVIAVDIPFDSRDETITTLFDVIAQTIDVMERQMASIQQLNTDITLFPKVGHITVADFSEAAFCIQAGYEEAIGRIDEIKTLIKHREGDGLA